MGGVWLQLPRGVTRPGRGARVGSAARVITHAGGVSPTSAVFQWNQMGVTGVISCFNVLWEVFEM